MDSIDQYANDKLEALSAGNLMRRIVSTHRGEGGRAVRDGSRMISFCCNDYLGLSQHPEVKAAAVEATERFGTGAGASRLITGSHPLYATLEARLAAFKGTEAAIVFGSGFLTNAGVIPCFADGNDLILADELSHACLLSGSRLAGADVRTFPHNDVEGLQSLLEAYRDRHPRCLILTEGVFSMDGDLAPIDAIAEMAKAYDAWLLVDDAHGTGVVGRAGRGSRFVPDEPPVVHLQTGTLSKAVGAYGGFLCGSAPVIELMKNRARTLIYTTGLPPGTVAAAIKALEIIESDADLRARPVRLASLFCGQLGLPTPSSPIVPVIVGGAESALSASETLAEKGFLVSAIRPPTVPDGTSRLRITFSAAHSDDDVMRLAEAVGELDPADDSTTRQARAV